MSIHKCATCSKDYDCNDADCGYEYEAGESCSSWCEEGLQVDAPPDSPVDGWFD